MLYEGRHILKKSRKKSRLPMSAFVLCASLLLIVGAIVGTLAWLTADTDPVINSFEPAYVSCKVEEDFNSSTGVKENAKIKNTSDIPTYIRVRLVGYDKDAEGNIVGGTADWLASVSVLTAGNWFAVDNYYYYKLPVAPGALTDNLIDRCQLQDGQVLEILAEAIQSQPSDAVELAWADVDVAGGNLVAAESE